MSLFGLVSKKEMMKQVNILYNHTENARGDRARIKGKADKLGTAIVDLECRVKAIEEGLKHGRKKGK